MFSSEGAASRRTDKLMVWLVAGMLVIVPLTAGLITFRDYGESADENHLYNYAQSSLDAYRHFFPPGFDPDLGKGNFRYYGPAFLMAANLFVHFLGGILPDLIKTDAWHLAYFLSFLVCAWAFYSLARRRFSRRAALTTSLLFLSQPLLWGHAFINPKDIPFMAFFLLGILSGLTMQEKLFPANQTWNWPASAQVKGEWINARPSDRGKAILLFLLSFLLFAVYIFGQMQLTNAAVDLVKTIHAAADGVPHKLLLFFAPNYRAVPAEFYAAKLLKFVNPGLFAVAFAALVPGVFHFRRIFSQTLSFLNKQSSIRFIGEALNYLRNPLVLLAGISLGLAISVRVIGPLAGIIVFVVAFMRAKSKTLSAFLAYSIIAVLVAYLTWPYLWPDPIGRFDRSLIVMSEFPWAGKVLFNGVYYPSDQLPLSYVPVLFGIQFTEPAVLLFVAGLYLFARQMRKRTAGIDFSALTLGWGLVPLAAFTILRPSLYDNFRQLFFIVPSLFLVIALAVEKTFQLLRTNLTRTLFAVIILVPGIWPIIHLHPYQYVYYNSFAGGVRGAARRFEADYWSTSLREDIEYLNRIAPPNARVIVFSSGSSVDKVSRFARPDLVIDPVNGAHFDPVSVYDYAIVSTRGDRDLKEFTDWTTLYTVERDGNVYSLVKQNPAR